MILKILLVLAVIGVVYFIFFKKKPVSASKKPTAKKDKKLQSNDMVACSTCGVYIEVGETIISNNKYFCSDECLEKA